ncbi:MAG: LysM peptidoglycan-binding domain-containing protein [Eubacteriales bacterium]|nr:LysM peptidoglycan-binding domain-containing protein [Eubacteriales bacterium]
MAKKRTVSSVYRIQPGDCLYAIAQKLLGSGDRYPEIKALNGMSTDILLPGQRIRIPMDNPVEAGSSTVDTK